MIRPKAAWLRFGTISNGAGISNLKCIQLIGWFIGAIRLRHSEMRAETRTLIRISQSLELEREVFLSLSLSLSKSEYPTVEV